MKNFETILCPICKSDNKDILLKKVQFDIKAYVSICKNDGLVYLNPRWTKKKYDQYYKKTYDTQYRPEKSIEFERKKAINNSIIIHNRIKNYCSLNQISSVLDVGSGMGWSLEWFKKKYNNIKNIYAIEMSTKCKSYIKNDLGGVVISDDAEKYYEKKNIDLTISRHSLEHSMQPDIYLKNIYNNLSDDGLFYLEVPDMMNFFGRLQKYWFRLPHTYYFSKNTLLSILNKIGFETIIIKEGNNGTGHLWCLLKKKDAENRMIEIENVYFIQKKKIIKQLYFEKLNFIYRTLRNKLIHIVGLLLPESIKRLIKLFLFPEHNTKT